MDIKTQVRIWVERKFGKVITKDINDKITTENSDFDIESYVNGLLDKLFKENEVEHLRETLNEYFLESETSGDRENNSQDSFEFESQEFQALSSEEIINNLKNKSIEVRINTLRSLELSAEDLITQSSWNTIKQTLQGMLEFKADVKIHNAVLKVFQKFLTCSNKPQLVCEGFITLTEVISYQIELINAEDENIAFEEIYDLKKDKWLYKKMSSPSETSIEDRLPKGQKVVDPDLLIKSMWLLIECQKQMPEKWVRFHQKRFREIIFSFIRLLSLTSTAENQKLSGLELLSVLNPTASWCLHWCHTATGRALICSALRKYKKFFIRNIEIILSHLKTIKTNQSQSVRESVASTRVENYDSRVLKPFSNSNFSYKTKKENVRVEGVRSKWVRSAPTAPVNDHSPKGRVRPARKSSAWIIRNIPRRIVNHAVFTHSVFLISCLIQYRSGRALFPVQTSTRKRLLSVQDLSLSVAEYLENLEYYEWHKDSMPFTPSYKAKVFQLLGILKKFKTGIHSSRLSAECPPHVPESQTE